MSETSYAVVFQSLAALLIVPAIAAGFDPWLLLLTSPLLYANILVMAADYIIQQENRSMRRKAWWESRVRTL